MGLLRLDGIYRGSAVFLSVYHKPYPVSKPIKQYLTTITFCLASYIYLAIYLSRQQFVDDLTNHMPRLRIPPLVSYLPALFVSSLPRLQLHYNFLKTLDPLHESLLLVPQHGWLQC